MNIPQEIKAVIFDVDGLLINSEPSWQKSHNEFIGTYSLDVSDKYKASLRGIGLKELIMQLKEKFHIDKSIDELLEEYRKIFYKNFHQAEGTKLFEGVEDCVKAFYDKEYILAIATGGHSKETMEQMLEEFNLKKYFSLIVSSDEVHRGKPNPEVFLHTAERLNKKPEECLVVEDSVNGILAGKAAGMYVIGVNNEEKLYNQLKEHGADEVFHNLSQLHL